MTPINGSNLTPLIGPLFSIQGVMLDIDDYTPKGVI